MAVRSSNANALALGFVMVLMLLALGGRFAEAAGEIGEVRLINVWAYRTPPQTERGPLYRADDVFTDELVETVKDGALHIRFLDNTRLRLGSASRVTLDSFVYDPSTNAGEMVADLGEGVFRFITGKLNDEGFQIRTPVAVIGVRGTDFIVSVAPDGATTVSVLEGLIEVTARVGGGGSTSVGVGQAASVSALGQVSLGVAVSSPDPGLAYGGGRSQTGGGAGSGEGGSSGGSSGGQGGF